MHPPAARTSPPNTEPGKSGQEGPAREADRSPAAVRPGGIRNRTVEIVPTLRAPVMRAAPPLLPPVRTGWPNLLVVLLLVSTGAVAPGAAWLGSPRFPDMATPTVSPRVVGAGAAVASGAPLAITSFTANPALVTLPNATFFNVTATGGVPPLSYWYTRLPVGCLTQNTSSLRCTPYAAQFYYVTVIVNDSAHAFVNATLSFRSQIVYNPPPVIVAYDVVPSQVKVGQKAVFNVTVTGGTGLISFFFAGLPPGCTSFSASQLSCIPKGSGTFDVRVIVSDSVGFQLTQIIPFHVTPGAGSATTAGSPLLNTALALGGSVAIAAVLLAVGLLFLRRSRRVPPPPN